MNSPQQYLKLRMKKLGLLMYDVRTSSNISIEECADQMGVSPSTYEDYETGTQSPSLPTLEAFSYYLNIPLEHFWGQQSLSEISIESTPSSRENLRLIRNHIIGTQLKQSRTVEGVALEALAETSQISAETIEKYEEGEDPVPLAELELIAKSINLELDNLFDINGPIGAWRAQYNLTETFLDLPTELQEFICMPGSQPYIEMARQFSLISADKLRSLGESILEITN
jgi:transcriptional regulator with XRE-family HTH domain